MTRIKTLSWPLFSAVLASAALPASKAWGAFTLVLETAKTYRQHSATNVVFRDGTFDITLADGIATYLAGCYDFSYFPPGPYCTQGSTGFLGFGNLDPYAQEPYTYYMVTGVTAAQSIEPRREDLCLLTSAPYSTLSRPTPGFKDTSYSVYYDISPASIEIQEYIVTRYGYHREYQGIEGGSEMDREIVPGTYNFAFPRLGNPIFKVAVPSVYNPIPEGYGEIHGTGVTQGVRFTSPNQFDANGYTQLDRNSIPTIRWEGMSSNLIRQGFDSLYFSVRNLVNPDKPKSDTDYLGDGGLPQSIFPNLASGADPRVLLASPLISSYTLPPFIETGTKAVIELELVRSISTNRIAYDNSHRKFQLPVFFVDYYNKFAPVAFGNQTKKIGILQDFDNDGYNNLTEWALRSNANQKSSIPRTPVPFYSTDPNTFFDSFGFVVKQLKGRFPAVDLIVERSTDNGKTWSKMLTDENWRVRYTEDAITVKSKIFELIEIGGFISRTPIQPPGTEADIYRIKVTLR